MAEEELDPVAQLRRVGIGLVLGGVLFGALTVALDVLIAGSILIGVGLAVWIWEYRSRRTVGIGVGIGFAGLMAMTEYAYLAEFEPLEMAALVVAVGVADYFLAPVYVRIQEAGEKAGNQ